MTVLGDQARLLQQSHRDLDAARADRSTWLRLAFTPQHTDDERITDGHYAARFSVLWAAQYDRQDQDLPLLRFLLEQEITRYRQTAPLGLAPDLELAGLLVAEHRVLCQNSLRGPDLELR